MKDIEQGMIQINSLQSNNAKMKILPGSKYETSIIKIENKKNKRFNLILGYDNLGQKSTGEERGKSNLIIENLIGFNDTLNLNYQNTLYCKYKKNSNNYGGSVSIPFGYYTFDFGISKSEYLNKVHGNSKILTSEEETLTKNYGIKRALKRTVKNESSIKANLMLKDDKNYIEKVELEQSSKKLSVFSLDYSNIFKLKQER